MAGTRGFLRIILLLIMGVVGLLGSLSVREFTLPEMRGLNEPVDAPVPPIPAGLRRPDAIQIHDTLEVRVAGEPGLSGGFTVDDAGTVELPMAGMVEVAGLTPSAAATRLAGRLADGYLMDPVVSVDVRTSEYQTVFVLGHVTWPRAVTAAGPVSLTQAVALAGGPTGAGGNTVLVVRPDEEHATSPTSADDRHARTFSLDTDRDGDEALRDGDTVFVRAVAVYFVLGEVRNQGVYALQPGMTVAQALSTAGGITDDGSPRGIRISRLTDGKRAEVGASDATILNASDIIRIRRRLFH